MQKILFIGASGMLGKPVAGELIRSGYDVSLLARDTVRMQQLFPDSKIIKGDVFDKASIVKAMKGIDTVYCNLSVVQISKEKDLQTEREGLDNIILAAKETGIKRLAYVSSLVHLYEGVNDFSWWAFRIKKEAIQKIKAAGTPFTILYPSTFMETFPFQMLRGNKIVLLGNSLFPMWFIAARDYAKQVAKSFQTDSGENKEYTIQGPESFTFDEAAKIFACNYTKARLKRLKAPAGLMKFLGNFSQRLNYGWHICEALNKYPEKFESEITWKELGIPSVTLAEYAKGL